MKSLLKLSILLLLSLSGLYAQPYPLERADQYSILPVISDYFPDSNFTFILVGGRRPRLPQHMNISIPSCRSLESVT